ncbi:carboxypeptidase-like regulatory domain-containing protein [Phnomibacter sp. MR]|uniref:carboxypeptidase-like regulatory domain-containing protein n=1 Tax=Phnomibacter sp. MR TaxID=3042318 RepID=UPI003A7FEF5B
MKRFFTYTFVCLLVLSAPAKLYAQQVEDSVVQLYGVVMTADSLRGLDGVSVSVKGKGRGTITNYQGVFSIAVLKGDVIEFSFIGFKSKLVTIPKNMHGSEYSIIQLLTSDTNYLPGTVIRPRPTRPQFERDFVNTDIPADEYEVARQNVEEQKRAALMASLPNDGREAINYTLRQRANASYYTGQLPPQNIFNPFAWNQFIKAWKRGDFKKKR